jgi:hypothetical protein
MDPHPVHPGWRHTVRGLLINNSYRGIMLDTTAATNNYIIGNWIGFTATTPCRRVAMAGVMFNNGANVNHLGTAALADRNVIGNFDKRNSATDGHQRQHRPGDNVLCIRPNGLGALCQIAIDHGLRPEEWADRRYQPRTRATVTGPTAATASILAWLGTRPAPGNYSSTWAVSGHRAIGNWIGFRADGS